MNTVDDPHLAPAGVQSRPVVAWRGGPGPQVCRIQPDWLADEVPIALVFNGLSHAVMLASPADLEDFALGFGLTEGLLASPLELYDLEIVPGPLGIELQLTVASACLHRLKSRRRTLAGRTGCGLCGTDSLTQVRQPLPAAPVLSVAPAAVARAQRGLREWQPVQQLTGASHAAGWCTLTGEILLAREDVGRHNALDKLVGAMTRAGVDASTGFLCITSRASFEMVQKAARAGAGLLAAVSAPTALAVETAQACGMTLAGFVRGDDLVAYTFAERLGLTAAGTN